MAGETTVYTILGYDKDADVYVRLAIVYDGLNTAIKIANCMTGSRVLSFGSMASLFVRLSELISAMNGQ